jgi:hypothetical protein
LSIAFGVARSVLEEATTRLIVPPAFGSSWSALSEPHRKEKHMSKKHLISSIGLVLAVSALFATAALAGKPAKQGTYPGTLTATPNALHAGDYFDVTGCGYDTSLGNVIVGFTGGGWGSALDSNGCFTISHIPALSGDTLPAGTYEVTASQYVHGRWVETGDTTVTVVS